MKWYDRDNYNLFVSLFELLFYVHGKLLRSCQNGWLFYHTVPWQAHWRQFFTSIYLSILSPSN